MSKHRVVILRIVANQLTVTEAAAQYGISRRHLQRVLARYRQDGVDVSSKLGPDDTNELADHWSNNIKELG